MLKALYKYTLHTYHTCNGHVLWTIPTGANSGEVSCPRTQRLYRRSGGGGFRTGVPQRPFDLMINAQPTAPLRPSSHLKVIKAL